MAVTALVPSKAAWVGASLIGTDVTVGYRLDRPEHRRRRDAGLGAILSIELLGLLMNLPAMMPVPVASLTARERRLLAKMPTGAIARNGAALHRLAVAPVQVDLAVVRAATWRTGLELAGRFAPFTMRMMLLPAVPADADLAVMEATYYGIGVMTDDEVLVAPRPYVRRRHTAAGWLFSEQVYDRFC